MLRQNGVSKYLLYALGEILLVVFGILIALKINNLNTERKNAELAEVYLESLIRDLVSDTIDINRIVDVQKKDLLAIKSTLNKIHLASTTIDTMEKIIKLEYDYAFKVKRDYANNTFNTIISSGNIELLDKELVEKLMDLNSLQIDQLERFRSNIEYYQSVMSMHMVHFPINVEVHEGDIIDQILWDNLDPKELVGTFVAALGVRKFMFENTTAAHTRIKEKSIEIINFIEEHK
ncbi:DUF6090 family protein [Portibacter marinus]|uniref:DUF6090 family protein n=1 Tax=Portibacter marinus TaxID=2898660 RepID=UPI001F1D5A64|nr:DUF6090 family protein [Portibacter marinus]